jgi:hydroxypyruvate isomerase
MRTSGLRFDVNCSILFTGLPLLERPAAAKAAGFDAVEFWWPFAGPVPAGREADDFVAALNDAGVRLVSLNFAAGDMAAGDRGWVSDPAKSAQFRDNIDVCVEIARRTGCTVLNALYGNQPCDDDLAARNLVAASQAASRAGATVVIEALNAQENPRYPITSTRAAIKVIEMVRDQGAPSVGFLADLYHLAMMGEDLPAALTSPQIAHIQIADVPGRGAPGTGTVDFQALFAQLAAQGYPGWVGCEYRWNGVGTTSETFAWKDLAWREG